MKWKIFFNFSDQHENLGNALCNTLIVIIKKSSKPDIRDPHST